MLYRRPELPVVLVAGRRFWELQGVRGVGVARVDRALGRK